MVEVQPHSSTDAAEQDQDCQKSADIDNVHAQHGTDSEAFYVELSIKVAVAFPRNVFQSLLIALCISRECIAVFAEAFRQNLFDDPNVVFVTNGNAFCSG